MQGIFILFLIFDTLALVKLHFWSSFVSGITVFCLIVMFLKYDFKNTRGISLIKKLGKISYSLYLVHIPVLIFIYSLLYKATQQLIYYNRLWYITGVLISVLAGWLLYKFVEKPSMQLISRIKKTKKG